ncbi:transposase (plasmid) [Pseudomonas sp. R1-18]|uniref:RNA-guided endonuclease InsQ/TnpB family protein n=1 Tax=Pseudomonas sp. R1-18 TaxID=1632772 RepID=UPI003DA8816A
MKRQQAYKFRLKLNGAQQRQLGQFAGTVRKVWNTALALQKDRYEAGEKKLSYAGLCRELTRWRNDPSTPWMKETSVDCQQQVLKDLDRAYTNFFAKRADFPRFKKKGQRDSFRFPQPRSIKLDQTNSRISLPKLGWLRYINSRQIEGTLRNVTLSLKAGHWYVSVQTERDVEQPITASQTAVGIDMGVVRFATLWDGQSETVITPINSFKTHQLRLAKAQRQMSRKQKFSRNWSKARARVSRIHHQIANTRNDFLHNASHRLSKNHALLCVEALQIKNMSRSGQSTLEQPGRNVNTKSGLNRAILDQGWGEFVRQLDYKCSWNGAWLVKVPAMNTSRECPGCGYTHAANRPSQSVFVCGACGHTDNADKVASQNIRARGLKLFEGPDMARIACPVNGEIMPSATGTRRSDLAAVA